MPCLCKSGEDIHCIYIDDNKFLDALRGECELLIELAHTFLNNPPKTLIDLEQAVKERDKSSIELWAHDLKGALSMLEAEPAVVIAHRLEIMGETGSLAYDDTVFKEL
ncbi:MAG: Hpt domain-containing protein [Proteobacteria bacterium]|nr:MAG: Hpt domain-containing protein [Pseudomonadota bacterium]